MSSIRTSLAESSRRRSARLFLTVPIRVEGLTPNGQKFSETTRTLVINRHGARIQLRQTVTPGATLRIFNLVANRDADFRVVGPTQPRTERGGEWGVECRDENRNIWGIDFPPPASGETTCSALLECRRCQTVALMHMSLVELDVLASAGLLTKECKQCGQATSWAYTEKQLGMPEPGPGIDPSLQGVIEPQPGSVTQRAHRRVALRLPIRARNYYGVEEFTKSENVSKTGLCFASEKEYEVGETLLVTCPYNPGGHNIEMRARLVRRHDITGTARKLYGLQYEKET